MSASSYDVRASWPAPIQERLGEMEDMHRRSPHDRFVKCRESTYIRLSNKILSAHLARDRQIMWPLTARLRFAIVTLRAYPFSWY